MAAKEKKITTGDIKLNTEYYDEIDSEDIYKEERRVGKVFGAKVKSKDEVFIRAISKYKSPRGWKAHYGFNVYNVLHIDKLFRALKKISQKLGWKIKESEQDLESIKSQLREQQEVIIGLQQANNEARENHDKLLIAFREQQEKLLRSRVDEFKQTITQLKQKISDADTKKIPESELQEFLYSNTWLFGTEYVNAQPQKLRGAHSKFDFYLERFNKTNDIVEIKLLSDIIITAEGDLSAKVIRAVDQIIEYLESSVAAAHSSVISEEEGIRELRPRGIVIIGKDCTKEAKQKLSKWNYRLTHIKILTYQDILDMGETVLKHFEKQENVKTETKTN